MYKFGYKQSIILIIKLIMMQFHSKLRKEEIAFQHLFIRMKILDVQYIVTSLHKYQEKSVEIYTFLFNDWK